MFRLLFILVILLVMGFLCTVIWDKLIHPWLFAEEIEEKIEEAVEKKIMNETDKKVEAILEEEEDS